MKKLTRERVVPIISASVSWLIFGMTTSGLPSFPKWAMNNKIRAKPLLAGIEELIHQILLDANVASQDIGKEQRGEGAVVVEHTEHRLFVDADETGIFAAVAVANAPAARRDTLPRKSCLAPVSQ